MTKRMPAGSTPEDRFWAKVDRQDDGACWPWMASVASVRPGHPGYGWFWGGSTRTSAHRFAYELLVGPIPDGLTIDHLCRNTICCNPAHMEPVTNAENNRRSWAARAKPECPQGHLFTEENTNYTPQGRRCRECGKQRARERYYRVRPHGDNTGKGSGVVHAVKTHCPQGHPYDGPSIPGRERICRICHVNHQRAYTARMKE